MKRAGRIALTLALLSLAATWPRPGGDVRLLLPGEPEEPTPAGLLDPADLILSGAVFSTLVRPVAGGPPSPELARSLSRQPTPEGGERWSIALDRRARFPDGTAVRPADVIASWEELLRSNVSPYRFLLGPVVGAAEFGRGAADEVAGLAVDGDDLILTTSRPVPDLLWRLAHPAMGIGRASAAVPTGSGPFTIEEMGLGQNRFHPDGAPFLRGISLVGEESVDPSLQLEAGEADVSLLYGRAAGTLLDRSPETVVLGRAPAWDRSYSLAINPASGFFVHQVTLRKILGQSIDRTQLLRVLFEGQGEPIGSMLPGGPQPDPTRFDQPLSGTRQRLSLTFDRNDAHASRVAARLKAAWESIGLLVDLEGVSTVALRGKLLGGNHHVALLPHQPATDDPVLSLRATLSPLGSAAADAIDALRAAESLAAPEDRLAAARDAEALLLSDSRLIPLVRLHAWLATSARLVGVSGDTAGQLRLDDAFFLP